jgi:CheY-like chemotaxis protein
LAGYLFLFISVSVSNACSNYFPEVCPDGQGNGGLSMRQIAIRDHSEKQRSDSRGIFPTRMGLLAEKPMEEILVVDDDKVLLELIKRILDREGIVSTCVSSGAEALAQIKERSFSLMITDYNMPGLDGLELSKKGLEMAPQMPIIMNTGGISANLTRRAKEIGISMVMAKPYLPEEMIETIRNVVGNPGAWATAIGQATGSRAGWPPPGALAP